MNERIMEQIRRVSEPKVVDLKGQPDWARKVEKYVKDAPVAAQRPAVTCNWRR